jgi:hypothetical protein
MNNKARQKNSSLKIPVPNKIKLITLFYFDIGTKLT